MAKNKFMSLMGICQKAGRLANLLGVGQSSGLLPPRAAHVAMRPDL